jgi:2'-5' RNA ligase
VAADNLHLTLAFLGEVSADKQRALAALAGRIRQPGFTLTLDDAGQWLRSAWCGSAPASRRAACCSWPACCAPRRRAAAAIKARSRFIRISPCCAMPATRCHPAAGLQLDVSVNEFVLYESSFSRGRTRYTRWNVIPLTRKADAV